jgi:hypothetical protein
VDPRRWRPTVLRFVAEPASPLPLAVLRIGLGLLLLAQTLPVAPHVFELGGSLGLVQAPVVDALAAPWSPRVGWIAAALAPLGFGEAAALRLVFAAHLLAALAFLLGWRSRGASIAVWLTNLVWTTTTSPHTYGIDLFMGIALFYCMFAPVGSALSCDVLAGRASGAPSFAARLSLRVLQAHLMVVYAATGIEKASGIQWWNGDALWRSWMRHDLGTIDFGWIAWVPWVAQIGCWTTLLIELGYAVLVWPRRTRKWWALATLALHAGIALTLGLWAFACIMMLLTTCAWLVPAGARAERRAPREAAAPSRAPVADGELWLSPSWLRERARLGAR